MYLIVLPPRHQSTCLSARQDGPPAIISLSLGHEFPDTISCVLVVIEDVEVFDDSSKPQDSCDEEVRHLGAFSNE